MFNLQDETAFKKYKHRKKSFLSYWNNYYFEKSGNTLILKLDRYHDIVLHEDPSFDLSTLVTTTDDFSSSVDEGYKNIKYFTEAVYADKDDEGKMPFVIIGENASDDAIVGYPLKESDVLPVKTNIYRIAFNTVFEFKYWP